MLEIVSNAIITKEDPYQMRVSLHNSSCHSPNCITNTSMVRALGYRASFLNKCNLIALIGLHEVSDHPGLFERDNIANFHFKKR